MSRRSVLGVAGLAAMGAMTACAETSGPSTRESGTSAAVAPVSPEPARPTFRFVTASDGHFGEPNTRSEADLTEFVGAVNALHASTPLDLVVVNGDIGHGGVARLRSAKEGLDDLAPRYLAVPGNHDGVTAEQWQDVWGTPENQVVRFGDRSVVCANTSDLAGDFLCADTSWLSSALAAEAAQTDVFVVMHITPRKWTKYGIDCPRVRSLLAESPNVRAVFNGHDHDQDGIRTDAGLPYLFDAHYGGHWGTDYRGFRFVEAGEHGLTTRMISVSGKKFPQRELSWAG